MELQSVADVINELGGPTATGRLVGRSVQAVVNWRLRNKLPPDTFKALQGALHQRGATAPDSLWRMVELQ